MTQVTNSYLYNQTIMTYKINWQDH